MIDIKIGTELLIGPVNPRDLRSKKKRQRQARKELAGIVGEQVLKLFDEGHHLVKLSGVYLIDSNL